MRKEQLIRKMIEFYHGNVHDISHFLKVTAYAETIAALEGLNEDEKEITVTAAIVHDIACPLCREKYGSCPGPLQELESHDLLVQFFEDIDISKPAFLRIDSLVSRHHTYTGVDGTDLRILLEADFLVNAEESGMTREAILHGRDLIFRTASGTALLNSVYSLEP